MVATLAARVATAPVAVNAPVPVVVRVGVWVVVSVVVVMMPSGGEPTGCVPVPYRSDEPDRPDSTGRPEQISQWPGPPFGCGRCVAALPNLRQFASPTGRNDVSTTSVQTG